MKSTVVETRRGAKVRVFEAGRGAPVVFFHSGAGLLAQHPFLDQLAERYHVVAPELPGFGDSVGEELLDDMLDFALHGWDVIAALGLSRPHLIGHSMGGMIAAEMACIAPNDVAKLVLVAAAGLWIPEHPIPDLFALLPFEVPPLLFHDPVAGAALLTGGLDFGKPEALAEFYIANAKRMGVAGKILFPIPNRGTAKRLYRLTAPVLILWGQSDQLIPPVYADKWASLVPGARLGMIGEAGHMLPYEQPAAFVSAVTEFLG